MVVGWGLRAALELSKRPDAEWIERLKEDADERAECGGDPARPDDHAVLHL